jgi:CRISPR system Cascade subunit CasD
MPDDVMSLAMCFDAPMQSWGIRSRGIVRDTMMEPTKSGTIGLVAAALGVNREDDVTLAELARLRLAVRVDREGLLERDYQTTRNVPTTTGTGHRTVVSERYYLADALFLVVLEGDGYLLARIAEAIRRPRWPLSFGRRSFVPARPLLSPDAAPVREPAVQVLKSHPWLEESEALWQRARTDPPTLRTVVECSAEEKQAEVRHDQPISFGRGRRRFAPRTVLVDDVTLTPSMIPARSGLVPDQTDV